MNGSGDKKQEQIDPMMGLRQIIAELNRENAMLRQLVIDYALCSQIDKQSDPRGERWAMLCRRSWELARNGRDL